MKFSPSRRMVLATAVAGIIVAARRRLRGRCFQDRPDRRLHRRLRHWGPQFQNAIEAYQAIHGKTVKGPNGKDIDVQFVYRDTASAGAGQGQAARRRTDPARKGEDARRASTCRRTLSRFAASRPKRKFRSSS